MNMKNLIITATLLLVLVQVNGQKLKTAGYVQKEVEVGVIEHLGDTIPLDLWIYNE